MYESVIDHDQPGVDIWKDSEGAREEYSMTLSII